MGFMFQTTQGDENPYTHSMKMMKRGRMYTQLWFNMAQNCECFKD